MSTAPYPLRLETERLVVRPWRHEEAPRMLDILGRYEVMRWLGDGEVVVMADLDAAHRRIDRDHELSAVPPLGFWAIERPDGVVAGTVLLSVLPNAEDGEVEIGWHLHPDSWGHGYATEAARAVLGHGFEHGLPEIWATSFPDNDPSIEVMRRLSMTDRGIHERWYQGDSRLYSTTLEEWRAQQA